jgi:hypothetical protein
MDHLRIEQMHLGLLFLQTFGQRGLRALEEAAPRRLRAETVNPAEIRLRHRLPLLFLAGRIQR